MNVYPETSTLQRLLKYLKPMAIRDWFWMVILVIAAVRLALVGGLNFGALLYLFLPLLLAFTATKSPRISTRLAGGIFLILTEVAVTFAEFDIGIPFWNRDTASGLSQLDSRILQAYGTVYCLYGLGVFPAFLSIRGLIDRWHYGKARFSVFTNIVILVAWLCICLPLVLSYMAKISGPR